ncbi:peptidoglycan DD-metalloendopeptidase family protein [Bacillus salitolerans]|uniref:Peptidoglycan DD-metalloendopeptidase family protein n=1 Tax=Bacillus salitolerans TaxID=1437434 RepID=A0ABW4LPC8_9BACI
MREEEKFNSQKSKSQQFFKKRWVFPAIYLASAALILTAVLWYQNSTEIAEPTDLGTTNESEGTAYNQDDEAVPVTQTVEKFSMPVVDPNSIEIQKHFYDDNASAEEQEAALVFYNNTYTGNTGIDIVSKNGESFDVVASLSGTVTKSVKDPMLGYVVEVDHGNGITSMYSALENVKVEEGATVTQGEMLASAGRSLYNSEAGIHTHFEIRKDGTPVNPLDFFEKPLSSLQEEEIQHDEDIDDKTSTEPEQGTEEEEEEQPGEGEGDSEENTTDTPDASIGQGQA